MYSISLILESSILYFTILIGDRGMPGEAGLPGIRGTKVSPEMHDTFYK